MTTLRGSRKSQRGAAALEFAIVVPVLILLVFGIIDFGGVMNAQVVVQNASREGARAAALGSTTASTTVRAAMATLPNYNNTTINQVTVTCTTSAGVTATCGLSTNAGGTATVTVAYRYSWLSPVPLSLSSTVTLTQTSKMRIE